jgi:hypothetical protein
MPLQVCATHAQQWSDDGIILRPSEVLDVEPTNDPDATECVECRQFVK